MGRPLRRHAPGTYHLITSRCHQARFLLRPEGRINDAILEWLARAQNHWPGVLVCAVCVMSNHVHLLVHDTQGELAAWSAYFFGNLARAVNRIRGRQGAVFARRYSAEPVLDEQSLLERLVYVVTNPVKARLCSRAVDWPGVVLWSRSGEPEGVPVRGRDRGEPLTLVIHPLPGLGSVVEGAIEQAEGDHRQERLAAGAVVVGRQAVLLQPWEKSPGEASRSHRPLCHAATVEARAAFRELYRSFVGAYREASARFRDGVLDALFPPWSYPPGRPMVRAT